jgi:hypothetical protein
MLGPERLPDAENKLLVLEYDNPLGAESGWQISELIGQMTLASIRGVNSFAVITLRQEQQQRLALTPAHVDELARKQHSRVVVWGEFYQKDQKFYVTSHIRVVEDAAPKGPRLRINWDVSELGIADVPRVQASAPTVQVNFAPIELSEPGIKQIEQLWNQTQVLRRDPRDTAEAVGTLPPKTPFFLGRTEGAWSQINVIGGKSGWVRLSDLGNTPEFKPTTGLVLYAQGLMQYFAGNFAAAAETFQNYLDVAAAGQDPMNQAMAHVLLGYAIFMDGAGRTPQGVASVRQHFEAAAKLLPDSASPVNCVAVALFKQAPEAPPDRQHVTAIEKQLVHVIQTENDVDAVRNLRALYQLPRAAEYFVPSDDAVDFQKARQQRLDLLNSLERQFQQPKH